MALPISQPISLSSGNLLVYTAYSNQGISMNASIGMVLQINYATVGYNVGDTVFYDPSIALQYFPTPVDDYFYYIIKESSILFIEQPFIPLP